MRLTDKERETMYKGFSEYGKRISVYAAYKDREYFAESFLSYHMGEKIIDPELRKFFDSLKVKDAKPVTKPIHPSDLKARPPNALNHRTPETGRGDDHQRCRVCKHPQRGR
jgi:hypothetical protein